MGGESDAIRVSRILCPESAGAAHATRAAPKHLLVPTQHVIGSRPTSNPESRSGLQSAGHESPAQEAARSKQTRRVLPSGF